jgi:hypothetical protein
MRKHASFGIAATAMALAMIFWAKSSVQATHTDGARSRPGVPSYVVVSSPYLPIQAMEEVY